MKNIIEFKNPDIALTPSIFDEVQREFELTIPEVVKDFYLANNGGQPSPFMFRTEDHEIVVNAILPLISKRRSDTVIDCYVSLVLTKKLVPKSLFPFAIDPGGEFFFVDTDSPLGAVFLFNSDIMEIQKLSDSFVQFWDHVVE